MINSLRSGRNCGTLIFVPFLDAGIIRCDGAILWWCDFVVVLLAIVFPYIDGYSVENFSVCPSRSRTGTSWSSLDSLALVADVPGMDKFSFSSSTMVSILSPSPQTATRSSLQFSSSLVALMSLVASILLLILFSSLVQAAQSQCTVGAVTRLSLWLVSPENNFLVVLAGIPRSL